MTGRASGKLILLGEHAVVYGASALAAALDRGVRVYAEPAETPGLVSPAWGVDGPLEALRHGAPKLAEAVATLFGQTSAAPATLKVECDLPTGSGLGSSAAFAVAAARALGAPESRVFEIAQAVESVFHGNPSGVDAAVAARPGGLMRFRKGNPPELEPQPLATDLHLVIARCGPPADTGLMVGGLRQRRDAQPELFDPLFAAVGALAERGAAALATGDVVAFGELMNVNQGYLNAFGVSTPRIEAACHLARKSGALGAKLTGGGGGGCAVLLATGAETAAELAATMDREGFESFTTRVAK